MFGATGAVHGTTVFAVGHVIAIFSNSFTVIDRTAPLYILSYIPPGVFTRIFQVLVDVVVVPIESPSAYNTTTVLATAPFKAPPIDETRSLVGGVIVPQRPVVPTAEAALF